MYFPISPTARIMKISTLFMALPRLVVTLNIKLIYISKNSKKNVLKQYSVSKLYSLFHGLHLLLADYVISLFFVCNSCHVAQIELDKKVQVLMSSMLLLPSWWIRLL